jgi:hypothetical protein
MVFKKQYLLVEAGIVFAVTMKQYQVCISGTR